MTVLVMWNALLITATLSAAAVMLSGQQCEAMISVNGTRTVLVIVGCLWAPLEYPSMSQCTLQL